MITIICSSQNPNEKFKQHILNTCGVPKTEFLFYENKNEYSLTEIYNKGLKESKNDIVVFLHDDIEIKTQNWGRKLLKHYKHNPDYGILGVAGSKYLPKSGKWWENPRSMYGQVYHTHEGNTWLSKYSYHIGNKIDNTVIVDGVFFSINKKNLKENFNENIKGFHFYDIDFSFKNFINGVKVGVHYDIKINHMSIGQTNNQWELNRKDFIEMNKKSLPVQLEENFEHRRMNILIGVLNFEGLTGSEVSTLETAKALSNYCNVSIISGKISQGFKQICNKHGIKTYTMSEPPGFKMGDGKWGFNTPKGQEISKEGMLYQISQVNFDVIHANHKPITEQLLKLYPNIPMVNIVRSEVIDLENPVIDDNIKKYVAIRPSIKEYLIDSYEIPSDKIEVIYNAFDVNKFKPKKINKGTDKSVTLFVGTMDYLRKQPIEDLINKCQKENKELWLVGKDTGEYANKFNEKYNHVKYFPPTTKIEDFYNKCDETAGIFLGRTTIEGFLCNKPAIIYEVDKTGDLKGVEYMEVPKDLSIFSLNSHINKMINIYKETYNKY